MQRLTLNTSSFRKEAWPVQGSQENIWDVYPTASIHYCHLDDFRHSEIQSLIMTQLITLSALGGGGGIYSGQSCNHTETICGSRLSESENLYTIVCILVPINML